MADRPTLREAIGGRLPARPTFDLSTEAWIDVAAPDGADPRRLSLREVLASAHTLKIDGSARGLLWVHATHRLLIALSYLVHAQQPDHPWGEVAAGGAPLPSDAIDAVLERLADHLWLHHPHTPFLQDLSVLDVMDATAHPDADKTLTGSSDPFWSLLPDVPSKSNTAWFGRAHELPAPDDADAACALLVRHCFALPGNEAPNHAAQGKTSKGGATGLTHHGRSFVTIAGPTLAATLVRNLLADWIDEIGTDTPTFFEQPHALARNLQPLNRLWIYTASAAATVLIPAPGLPDGYRVVRTPVPFAREAAKTLAATMSANDPHGLRVDAKTAGQPYSHVGLSAAGSDLDLVRRFYKDLVNQSALYAPTLLGRHALAYGRVGRDVDVLVIDGAGSSMGPRIAVTATFKPPAGTLTIVPERASGYLEIADKISGASGSASNRVAWRTYLVFSPDAAAPKPAWLYPTCHEQMAGAVERILRAVLTVCADPTRPLPDGLDDPQKAEVTAAALAVFDRLVAPHAARPAAVPHVVVQRRALTLDLDKLWS
jgi:hypothetical protein